MTARRPSRILARLGNLVLWVAAILGATSIVLTVATVTTGVQPLVFRSSSMSPAIDAGALALARSVPADRIERGDVVSVIGDDGVRVTHRVVEIQDAGPGAVSLRLRGDANGSPDRERHTVTEVDRVFFDVPYLGYVANAASSPWALFVAGILATVLVMSLLRRRGSDGSDADAGPGALAAVAVLGVALTAVQPLPRTEAYFSDVATFEAGAVQAHEVRIFDWWDATPCQDGPGGSITLESKVASPRYRQAWYLVPDAGAEPSTPVRVVTPSGAIDSLVSTTFTVADLGAPPIGGYRLVGRSQMKGAATTPWLSASTRSVSITVTDASTVRCGEINLPPSIVFTSPVAGDDFASTTAAENAVRQACASTLPFPCGTATDSGGIQSVQYRLQRENGLGRQCWSPGGELLRPTNGYWLTGCDVWRPASTTPATPTTSSAPVAWTIPVGTGITATAFNQTGRYTLYLRVTDLSGAVSERTIQFTVN